MARGLEVVAPGLMSTIQDLGRFGHQAQGMPVSGALDPGNLRLANALVGNDQGRGALEIRILGPTIRVMAESVRIALAGTGGFIEVHSPVREQIPACRSVILRQGQEFRVAGISDSAVCYLAVEGGFDLPSLYGSQSTYVSGGFGGFEGRGLQAGDLLPLALSSVEVRAEHFCPVPLGYGLDGPVRVVLGPQDDYFTPEGIEAFFSQTYILSADANRMGVRLQGEGIAHAKGADINSDGIVTGSVQVPGNGLPIILLADHQTTGGYPKIATVISADIARIGRMAPGAEVRFSCVTVPEAEAARRRQERQIEAAVDAIQTLPQGVDLFDYLLANSNLISGVIAE